MTLGTLGAWRTVANAVGACVLAMSAAQASMVAGWWGGSWNCTIDGRPARMQWSAVNNTQTSCSGGVCSSVAGASWKGRFSDSNSPWVPLTNARLGSQGGLYFRHADGNAWYLPKPTGNRTAGYTTWQGKRYPLTCSR